ncbi:MAG: hypothetical protein H0X12_16200 [Nocardioides sp.]|nr:hypothetical protein [Nocardioides sp.]
MQCTEAVDWETQQNICRESKEGWNNRQATAVAQGYRYDLERVCGSYSNGQCYNPRNCDTDPPLGLYNIYRADAGTDNWTLVATVCLDSKDGDKGPGPKEVAAEFKRLTWPQATLVIQPPEGETLVNFDTIFYTTTTQPVSQSVQLLGSRVEIVATPSEYTWHWDQAKYATVAADAEPFVTSDHGAPYPHQTITWQYIDAHQTVHPSIDITYSGRYRINGKRWKDLPVTHTVIGTPDQELDVLEAKPTLVN